MTILSQDELRNQLFESEPTKRLVITPILDPKQIGDASVDVRLGTEFIIIQHTNLPYIDPTQSQEIQKKIGQYQQRIRVAFREPFVLHPNQLVLGSTLEYVALPSNLAAQVVGRSSWGRLGLIIATATAVAPRFRGVITLELINHGQVPLILYPGVRIAQLIIQKVVGNATYSGRYDFPTGPQFSRIHEDDEMAILGEKSGDKSIGNL